ncbi:DUF2199 domain-containing protein [Massilia sp. 9I]|uniref:DUF2199 domain-containing protein n=1 Tax=Massilia sp. 9I TaxID=2653152 RepID=UPI0012F0A5EA|nr:DUF2199 domain-containing protein [Massilia sp. 9I]VXB17397.1 conserved hypothetical protein [Massilia sp. 9I]
MICSKCGEEHPLEEMELTFRRPDAAAKMTEDERARLVRENSDLCVIEGKRFFIRAVLPLPVEGRDIPYCIGLWVEVSQAAFDRIYDLWESDEQRHEPPMPAHLANEVPTAPGSLGLEAQLRLSGPTVRPEVFLKPGTHQLYLEQSQGVDVHRIAEYTALFA